MTFTTAKIRVLEVIKSIQEKMYMSQSRQFTDTTAKKPEIQSNIYMNSQSLDFQGSAIQQSNHQRTPLRIRCYNCRAYGHKISSCNKPWCNNCREAWSSTTDPRYHLMSQCPKHTAQKIRIFRPTAQSFIPSIENTKRPFKELVPDTMQQQHQNPPNKDWDPELN